MRCEPPSLPTQHELLLALYGTPVDDEPLCWHALELRKLHARRRRESDGAREFDHQRAELRASVDQWAATHLPPLPPSGAGESLGVFIDRLSEAAANAFHLLMTEDPGSDTVHAAWTRLAELENAYSDLTDDLARGWRRLPHTECDTTERSLTE